MTRPGYIYIIVAIAAILVNVSMISSIKSERFVCNGIVDRYRTTNEEESAEVTGFPSSPFVIVDDASGMQVTMSGERNIVLAPAGTEFQTALNPRYTDEYTGYQMLQLVSSPAQYLRHKDYMCYADTPSTPLYDFVWKAEVQSDGTVHIRNPYKDASYFLAVSGSDVIISSNPAKFAFRSVS